MDRHYLALDLGAESGRAILAKLSAGRVDLTELHRFRNTPVQLPTGLYWDTLRLFHEMCEGIRSAGASVDLDGLAVDSWGVDFALIGGNGALLENPRHYRDSRTSGVSQQLCQLMPRAEIFRQTGTQFMDLNSLCQLYATWRDWPDLLEISSKLLFMPDLFNYFLTGTFASERTIASTSQFYDPFKRFFATDMLRKLGIPANLFADLVDPGTELGPALPYISERCGLQTEVMVYATACHDTASAVAAVPAADNENWCYISSGTWSLMGVETNEPITDDGALRENFTNEAGVDRRIRFLKNIPGMWVLQECRRAWAQEGQNYSYAELMDLAATEKPMNTLLDLDEFTAPGNYLQEISAHCRRTGQDAPKAPGSVVRVILESLAARYKQVLESIEQLANRTIETIHIVGGGSQNNLLNQLTADKTGRRVVAGPAEATAVGNALTQAMGAGDIASLEELRAVVRQSFELQEFRPTKASESGA